MKKRCLNTNHPSYDQYGGRGIKLCDRWLGYHGFVNFLADMGEKPKGLSLERIDNNEGYSPGNCRWATPLEQSNNTRSNVHIWFAGERLTLSQFCRTLNLDRKSFMYHYRERGKSLETILLGNLCRRKSDAD